MKRTSTHLPLLYTCANAPHAGRTPNIFMDDSSICRAALSVGVGSLTGPFLVDFKVVEAEPAYQGALHAGQVLETERYTERYIERYTAIRSMPDRCLYTLIHTERERG